MLSHQQLVESYPIHAFLKEEVSDQWEDFDTIKVLYFQLPKVDDSVQALTVKEGSDSSHSDSGCINHPKKESYSVCLLELKRNMNPQQSLDR